MSNPTYGAMPVTGGARRPLWQGPGRGFQRAPGLVGGHLPTAHPIGVGAPPVAWGPQVGGVGQHPQPGQPAQGGLNPWDAARMMAWNKRHAFDAALDALRTQGLNQNQYSNLQGGHLPGGFHGLFAGMTPAQLKEVAGFVDSQGSMGNRPGAGIDPITGAPVQEMRFAYSDPRLQHGEAASENPTIAPWLRLLMR